MWQLEGHTAACPGGAPKPGRLRRHGALIRKTHPFPAPALCPARAALGASGWRGKTGVRGRMGGFLEEEGPSLSGRTAEFGYAVRRGRGRPGQGESGDGGEWVPGRRGFRWRERVDSHGRRGNQRFSRSPLGTLGALAGHGDHGPEEGESWWRALAEGDPPPGVSACAGPWEWSPLPHGVTLGPLRPKVPGGRAAGGGPRSPPLDL